MPNQVTAVPAASSQEAEAYFSSRFALETDCWDVHDALSRGATDFVLLDVRSPDLYRAGHVPGALSLPHGKDPRLLEALADPAGALLAAFRRARHVREALSEVVLIRVSLIPGGTAYCFRWLCFAPTDT